MYSGVPTDCACSVVVIPAHTGIQEPDIPRQAALVDAGTSAWRFSKDGLRQDQRVKEVWSTLYARPVRPAPAALGLLWGTTSQRHREAGLVPLSSPSV